jgi:mercuric ion transport protein
MESVQTTDKRKNMAATGGVIGALLASSCCILPLLLVILGVSGSWIGSLSELNVYQPYFILFASLCLGAGFWQVYIKPRRDCEGESYCAKPRSDILIKSALWGATALVALNATINFWAPYLY